MDIKMVLRPKSKDVDMTLTIASHCVEVAIGKDVSERNRLMMIVNHRQEVGTLYPKANISLLPSPTASYTGEPATEHHKGDYAQHESEPQIRDAFKAQTEYFKCPQLYFDFRTVVANEIDYFRALKAVIEATPAQRLPKEIITWSSRRYRGATAVGIDGPAPAQ